MNDLHDLHDDEIEDIRFCLGKVAQQNEDQAELAPAELRQALLDQCERFRRLARKISER